MVGNQDALGAYFPIVAAGNSDMTYELTRWIESDADARAFLAGKPDPSGMRVNTAYLQTGSTTLYPTAQFQPLDPGWTPARNDVPDHFFDGFQASWNPITGLDNVAQLLVAGGSTALDPATGICQTASNNSSDCTKNPAIPINFKRVATEPAGSRDLWAVTDNTAAAAYQLPVAQLVNSAGRGRHTVDTRHDLGPRPYRRSAGQDHASGGLRT